MLGRVPIMRISCLAAAIALTSGNLVRHKASVSITLLLFWLHGEFVVCILKVPSFHQVPWVPRGPSVGLIQAAPQLHFGSASFFIFSRTFPIPSPPVSSFSKGNWVKVLMTILIISNNIFVFLKWSFFLKNEDYIMMWISCNFLNQITGELFGMSISLSCPLLEIFLAIYLKRQKQRHYHSFWGRLPGSSLLLIW